MKKLLCLALLISAGSIYTGNISASNKPTGNKSGNNSKDIYKKTWIDFNKNGVKDVYEDPSAPIEARIADLLSQMTLEEKTCQMATLYGSGKIHGLLPHGQKKSGRTVSETLMSRRTDWVNSVLKSPIRMPTV